MPRMLVNEAPKTFASFLSDFTSHFSDTVSFALLTDRELELESGRLIGKQVEYWNGDTSLHGIIVDVLPLQFFK